MPRRRGCVRTRSKPSAEGDAARAQGRAEELQDNLAGTNAELAAKLGALQVRSIGARLPSSEGDSSGRCHRMLQL